MVVLHEDCHVQDGQADVQPVALLRLAFEGGDAESGGYFYVCDRTAELNEHFGDLLHKIQDLEASVCRMLYVLLLYFTVNLCTHTKGSFGK
jgi:hypothetical protein